MTAALENVAEALTVRPGDTLIVRVDPKSYQTEMGKVVEQLRELLPAVLVVVIAAEQLAVQRPDAAATGG